MSSIAHSSHMDIFQNLAVDLETEGRYLFLNCIANQLRYERMASEIIQIVYLCLSPIQLYELRMIKISYNFSDIQTAIHITSLVLYFICLPKQTRSPYRSKLHASYWKDLLSIGHIHGVSYSSKNEQSLFPYSSFEILNPASSKIIL